MLTRPDIERGAVVDGLLRGAVDLDCQSGPSPVRRAFDHVEAARAAETAGLRAIVYKDHWYSVTPVAAFLAASWFRESRLKLISGVVLNTPVGGLNPYAAEHALMLGGRVVWMPTLSATNHVRQNHRDLRRAAAALSEALNVLTPRWVVKDEVKEILDQVAKYDAVLAAGHLDISEVLPLFEEARRRGVRRLLVSHPHRYVEALPDELRALAAMGAYIAFGPCDDGTGAFDAGMLKEGVAQAGLGQSILGFGTLPPGATDRVAAGRAAIEPALGVGFTPDEVRTMIAINPCRLLGLDSTATETS
ncbi:DUF6282 family protein [Chelatococcus sp. GCM10030263]|uniref:DUF6282 family protein n=1 Tax=Chelatococcus sp. GCM10030263 TaxID=3273387 RepID=UPI00360C22FF